VNVRIARDGVEIGECDWKDREQLVNEEQVLPTDHYWYEGMEDWRLLNGLELIAKLDKLPAVATAPSYNWNR
jgi:hypothetical protein